MIVIADGGSTKCDWVFVHTNGDLISRTKTAGLNPNVVEVAQIPQELAQNPELFAPRFQVTQVFFYGSGCGLAVNQQKMQEALQNFFPKAEVMVKSDLTAAAYAAYNGSPAIVGILGTGSNACFFNGDEVTTLLPSLGFILGDDGSGSALGKALVKHFFMKKLPPDLHQHLVEAHPMSIEAVIQHLYQKPKANAYLAGFNAFIHQHKGHPFIQHLIFQEFRQYFEYQVLPYRELGVAEINFVGSIAFLYEDILRAVAAEFNLSVGKIVQKPMESLLAYHKNYIFPQG